MMAHADFPRCREIRATHRRNLSYPRTAAPSALPHAARQPTPMLPWALRWCLLGSLSCSPLGSGISATWLVTGPAVLVNPTLYKGAGQEMLQSFKCVIKAWGLHFP